MCVCVSVCVGVCMDMCGNLCWCFTINAVNCKLGYRLCTYIMI